MKKLITYLRIMVFLPFIFICSSQTMNAQGNGGGGNGGGGGGNGGGGHNGLMVCILQFGHLPQNKYL